MPETSNPTDTSRADTAVILLLVVLTGWLYFWCARQPGVPFVDKNPSGYYGLQAAGFLQGHLHAAIEPHPALKALPDPYDPVANAPYRVHDMTYYRGKYYLYFGVTPVVIFFLPWAAATGTHLTEPLAVGFFCFVGFGVGVALLVALRRRYFSGVSIFWLAAVILTWALGNYVLILLQGPPGFYQVPIACAFMLLMFGLAGVYVATHATSPGRGTAGLVWAGICAGLSLGCRPNYLPVACSLLLPVVWVGWRWRGGKGAMLWRGIFQAGVAAWGPVGCIGLGLLAYNHARFGNFLEFGIHYQLAGERVSDILLLSPKFILRNVPEYLFNGGSVTPYFPYLVSDPLSPLGGLRYFPIGWGGLLALWILVRRPWDGRAAWLVTVAVMGVGNLLLLSCFFGKTDRYPPDFMPCLVLLGSVGVMAVVHHWAPLRGSKWIRGGLLLLMAMSCGTGLVLMFNFSPAKTRQFARWEQYLNYPSYFWMQVTGTMPGLTRMEMVLAPPVPGQADPVIESGMVLGRRDALTLEHLEGNRVQFRFFHAGLGGPVSGPVPIEYGRRYQLEVLYGGMLPPERHPYFNGWSDQEIAAARNRVLVRLDGRVVLDAAMASYDSRPGDVRVGRSDYAGGALAEKFGGTLSVRAVERLRREDFKVMDIPAHQPLKLTVILPLDRTGASEPLVATGKAGLGDLIFVDYTGAGRLRFGIDHYGAGGPHTHEVSYDPVAPQEILVWMGTWASPRPAGPGAPDDVPAAKRLFLSFNNEVLLDSAHPFQPGTPPDTTVGVNATGSSESSALFTGRLIGIDGVPYESLPVTRTANGFGAVIMSVQFPAARVGASEPLVTTGITGAGDLLYVRYVDNDHVLFGFDHWGIGGFVSKPVKLEYGRTYRLEMTMGSLYPPEDFDAGKLPAKLKELVLIKLDDDIVLQGQSPCHPTRPDEIRVGVNRIGGSTTGWDFFGKILGLERPAQPAFPVNGQ